MVGGLSPWHLLIVLIVVLLLFGSKKLPDAARGLGRSMRIFKSEMKEMQNDGKEEGEQQQLPSGQQPNAAQYAQPQQGQQQYAQPQGQPGQPQQYAQPQGQPGQPQQYAQPQQGQQGWNDGSGSHRVDSPDVR